MGDWFHAQTKKTETEHILKTLLHCHLLIYPKTDIPELSFLASLKDQTIITI
jgi:hypothetical protein